MKENIENKVNEVIKIIDEMDAKNKLRLGLVLSESSYTDLMYNKQRINNIFNEKLKKIDEEYLVSYVNMRKYPIVLFAMAKIMEMSRAEQNQIAMYLVNKVL